MYVPRGREYMLSSRSSAERIRPQPKSNSIEIGHGHVSQVHLHIDKGSLKSHPADPESRVTHHHHHHHYDHHYDHHHDHHYQLTTR